MKKITGFFGAAVIAAAVMLFAGCSPDEIIREVEVPVGPEVRMVTFINNDGTDAHRTVIVLPGTYLEMPPNPVRGGGWYFIGWHRDPAGTLPWDFDRDTVDEDLMLFARWTTVAYTITFNMQGGAPIPHRYAAYGDRILEPFVALDEGAVFLGWYRDPDGNVRWNFAEDTVTGNMTLYARWDRAWFIVTFDPANGEPLMVRQAVPNGLVQGFPAIPVKMMETRPVPNFADAEAGTLAARLQMFRANYDFVGWFDEDGVLFDAAGTPGQFPPDRVTRNMRLTAQWALPAPINLPYYHSLLSAFRHIWYNPSQAYYVFLNEDVIFSWAYAGWGGGVAANQIWINAQGWRLIQGNTRLTLIGYGEERVIQRTNANGRLFTVGSDVAGRNNIELVLGENITLRGHGGTNNQPLVLVQHGATLTMLPGSRIENHQSSTAANNGAAVVLTAQSNLGFGSSMIMKGGTITNNRSTVVNTMSAGGVFVDRFARLEMFGGTITGNNAAQSGLHDVFVRYGATGATTGFISLSGDATIGAIGLGSTSTDWHRAHVAIGEDWDGEVEALNIKGNNATNATVRGWWNNHPPITGLRHGTLTTEQIERFTLGYFFGNQTTAVAITANSQPIADTHVVIAAGADIGRMVLPPAASITTQPAATQAVNFPDAPANLSVARSGVRLTATQWQVYNSGWQDIADATGNTFNTANFTDGREGTWEFRAVFSSPAITALTDTGVEEFPAVNAVSDTATVTVNPPLPPSVTIDTQPSDITVTLPDRPGSFSVAATGPRLSFQWYGAVGVAARTAIPGATSATFNPAAATNPFIPEDTGGTWTFHVVVTSEGIGTADVSVTSDVATVTVNP